MGCFLIIFILVVGFIVIIIKRVKNQYGNENAETPCPVYYFIAFQTATSCEQWKNRLPSNSKMKVSLCKHLKNLSMTIQLSVNARPASLCVYEKGVATLARVRIWDISARLRAMDKTTKLV
jgi:hypothetical protein